ncbi:hypothetical protein RJ640_025225 [Escallonia rubra]|uniref:Uncharacterized protein n=1 Tax=Escallonia rubra TaxID=112253 RepID=A0AA88RNM7_9ASTE|nr:hypothetical protein RJ640_025225 [Escallonia rubra]
MAKSLLGVLVLDAKDDVACNIKELLVNCHTFARYIQRVGRVWMLDRMLFEVSKHSEAARAQVSRERADEKWQKQIWSQRHGLPKQHDVQIKKPDDPKNAHQGSRH